MSIKILAIIGQNKNPAGVLTVRGLCRLYYFLEAIVVTGFNAHNLAVIQAGGFNGFAPAAESAIGGGEEPGVMSLHITRRKADARGVQFLYLLNNLLLVPTFIGTATLNDFRVNASCF